MFLDPRDVNDVIATLIENDFDTEELDHVDPCGPTIWIRAWTYYGSNDDSAFFDWVFTLVEPRGTVVEAGYS